MSTTVIVITFGFTMFAAMLARDRFRSVYKKHETDEYKNAPTGAELASEILRQRGVSSVRITEHKGTTLGDHYDERRKCLVLTSANFHGTHTAALGVAAQEVGHALQHADGYTPLIARQSAMRMTVAASGLVFIIAVILIAARVPVRGVLLGFSITWFLMMLYNLVTMPVEWDASRRSREMLEDMSARFHSRQLDAIYTVMGAACWRYTGAFLGSLRHVFYHLSPTQGGSKGT
ncbi:MAG: zinc metallopeptidase [Verrucomicrobiae bacterium]|nr:zinc metallopeptidase [Verrucomicrobiae bacterium]